MRVLVTHHVDTGEQRSDGLYEFYYEYDVYDFAIEGGFFRARAYTHAPEEVSVLGRFDDGGRPIFELLAEGPPDEFIDYLKERGFKTISVLGPGGYKALGEIGISGDSA